MGPIEQVFFTVKQLCNYYSISYRAFIHLGFASQSLICSVDPVIDTAHGLYTSEYAIIFLEGKSHSWYSMIKSPLERTAYLQIV